MPTVNIYYKTEDQKEKLLPVLKETKAFVANKLTCGDISLDSNEVSVRLIRAEGDGMIGNVEAEMTAFAFGDRVKKQDEICLDLEIPGLWPGMTRTKGRENGTNKTNNTFTNEGVLYGIFSSINCLILWFWSLGVLYSSKISRNAGRIATTCQI